MVTMTYSIEFYENKVLNHKPLSCDGTSECTIYTFIILATNYILYVYNLTFRCSANDQYSSYTR